ncbi:MAG: chorismate mutase [Candidatus Riflebacteria bacterium]|nr:chorismate mutase [Candidatus Riflebacteria bacterium]
MTSKTLEELRSDLDVMDRKLVEMLDQRAALTLDIRVAKQDAGIERVLVPVREAKVFSGLGKSKLHKLTHQQLEQIYVEIVSACRQLQSESRICVLGEKAGWVHAAAVSRFGSSCEVVVADTFEDFSSELARGLGSLGFASFTPDFSHERLNLIDALMSERFFVSEEFNHAPEFCVVSNTARDLSEAGEICVTADMLRQLRQFFISLSYDLKIKICRSMSEVLENMQSVNPVAAILPAEIAKSVEGLIVLRPGLKIESMPRIRFFTLASRPVNEYAPGFKTLLLCAMDEYSDKLSLIFSELREQNIKITDVHSVEFSGRPFSSVVALEMILPESREGFDKAIAKIESASLLVKVCGYFPVFRA